MGQDMGLDSNSSSGNMTLAVCGREVEAEIWDGGDDKSKVRAYLKLFGEYSQPGKNKCEHFVFVSISAISSKTQNKRNAYIQSHP